MRAKVYSGTNCGIMEVFKNLSIYYTGAVVG